MISASRPVWLGNDADNVILCGKESFQNSSPEAGGSEKDNFWHPVNSLAISR